MQSQKNVNLFHSCNSKQSLDGNLNKSHYHVQACHYLSQGAIFFIVQISSKRPDSKNIKKGFNEITKNRFLHSLIA